MNRYKNICFLIIISILIMLPNNVKGMTKTTNDDINDLITITTTPKEVNDVEDNLSVNITVKEGQWKTQVKCYENFDDESDLFNLPNDLDKYKGTGINLFNLKQIVKDNFDILTKSSGTKNYNLTRIKGVCVIFAKLDKDLEITKSGKKKKYNEGYYFITKSGKVSISSVAGGHTYDKRVAKQDKGTAYLRTIIADDNDKGADNNDSINYNKKACVAMRNGWYNNKSGSENDINESNKSEYITRMKAYFPYCWTDTNTASPIEFSNKIITEARKNFIDFYNKVKSIKFSTSEEVQSYSNRLKELTLQPDIWKNKTVTTDAKGNFVTNARDLSCNTSLVTEDTKYYYAEKEVLNNTYCKVTCKEEFTTTYSPPVATKAGLCFTYQVTVKSKVDCITQQNQDFPWPTATPIKICKLKARCDDTTDQAGPNEDFDSCINECDGGKYSQSCINKCYKKVYEKNNTKNSTKNTKSNNAKNMSNTKFNSKISATFMAKKCDESDPYKCWYDDDEDNWFNIKNNCQTWSKLEKNLTKCAKAFKEAKATTPNGSYVKLNNSKKYTWKPTSDQVFSATSDDARKYAQTRTGGKNSVINSMKRAAPYYLRTVSATEDLLKSFFAIDTGRNSYGARQYNIDEKGVKRQVSKNWTCGENCWFIKTDSTCNATSEAKIKEEYAKEIKLKQAEIEECSTKANSLCSDDKATFEIGANNEITSSTSSNGKKYEPNKKFDNANKSGEQINCHVKPQSNFTNDIFAKLPTDNDSDTCKNGVNGHCYGTDYPKWEYKTTITFPGAWINLKTGEVDYTDGKKSDQGYELEKYKYCTMYNSKNTNEKWWNWRVDSDRNSTVPDVNDYNIHATINTFGKFNWNLNFKCFYALSDSTGKCDSSVENCNKTRDDNCDPSKQQCDNKTSPENIDTRFVQTGKDLFPNNRKRGFNWTSAATDIALRKEKCNSETTTCAATKGYDINPEEYANEIKSKGDKVYEEAPEVHIQIDGKKDFETIGSQTSKIAKFDSESGENKTYKSSGIDGLYYYTSQILSDLKEHITRLDITYERGKNYK